VILGVITSPLALLLDFDCDSCAFCYIQDENKVYATPRGLRALRTGANILDSAFASPSYCRRSLFYSIVLRFLIVATVGGCTIQES